MARSDWKQPISVTLSKQVLRILRERSLKGKVSRSAVIEQAVLFLEAQTKEVAA